MAFAVASADATAQGPGTASCLMLGTFLGVRAVPVVDAAARAGVVFHSPLHGLQDNIGVFNSKTTTAQSYRLRLTKP